MKLLKVRTYQDIWYYVSADDWGNCKTLIPTRCKTGRREMDLPRGLRPSGTLLHRKNVVEVTDGPEVEFDEPFRAYLLKGAKP